MSISGRVAATFLSFEPIFSGDDVESVASEMKQKLRAPFVNVKFSTLGGRDRASILILISLQDKNDWVNGIVENSPYMRFSLDRDGTLEQFRVSYEVEKRFRKRRVRSVDEAIRKLNEYVSVISKMMDI